MLLHLCAILLLFVASCTAREIPSLTETTHNYETVYPRIVQSSRGARSAASGGDSELKVVIDSINETLTLHLKLNEHLVSPSFTSIHYDDDGNEIVTNGHADCFYQGIVEEHPSWTVIMNACGGLKGVFGDWTNRSQYYHLKPFNHSNPSLDQGHMLIPDSVYGTENGTCGTVGHGDGHSIAEDLESLTGDIERVRRQSPTGDYIVELAIVNDNRQYNSLNRDLSLTVKNAIDIVNVADSIFKGLGVRLVITHVVTWTSGDRISVVSDPNTLLENLRSYRRQINQPHDSFFLLTGQDLSGNTVGIAYLNTMCGSASVGLVQDGSRSTSSAGSTFAHELGHVFSLEHDTSSCSCSDRSGRCVMAAVSGFPAPEQWSSCSRSQIQTALSRSSNNLGRCLENEPTTTVGDPVCGNGIREGDEICDCGSPQECDDPCCDARTCRMAAGAQCTRGACCTDTCQFKAYGTTCRSSSGQCDIEEYCTGESSECPADVYKQDGSSCNNNQAYCFSGECQTYDAQCQYHFGSNMGVSNCYQSYNPQGNVFGNCGYTSTDYIPCSQSNAMCGQLFCNTGQYQNRISGVRVTIVTVRVFVNRVLRECQGFTPEPGTDMISPGLVNDGTKCRDGHLCFEQECIPVNNLDVPKCQVINGQTCSGRGVCNNRGQCSCNVGYIGSNCETASTGPSIDECAAGLDNCDQGCVNTEESYFCTCNDGYRLAADGHTCLTDCGGRLTTASGSFQTPGWPQNYPQENFQCEWIIELPNTGATIEFTIDDSAYGINGRDPCTSDNIEFFDGTSSNANSLERLCQFMNPGPITTSSSRARVVFTGTANQFRPASRVGVKVDYRTVTRQANECQNNNGGCEQICVDTAQSFECRCEAGYRLDGNGRSCSDINECSSNNGGCQHNCVNTDGSYECRCRSGYRLSSNGRSCTDINECSEGTDNCDQVCTNTAGSFTCSCNSGFTLDADGRSCTEELRCGGRLTGASGSFNSPGWPQSYPQENFQCEWIIQLPDTGAVIEFTIDDSAYGINGRDPCPTDYIEFFDGTSSSSGSIERLCKFDNPGPITTTSSRARVVFSSSINPNRPASRVGVKVNYRTIAAGNDDQCDTNNGGCDHVCVNDGQCQCFNGYRLGSDGRSCNDINECNSNNGGCQHNCVNTDGSYECRCRSGYRLSSDGKTCSDINECSSGTHNCDQVCTNTAGSFTCSCNSGFTLAANGRSCTEEEEEGGCGGRLTGATGSFQTPGWPQNYPQENFQCEWIIDLPDTATVIEFTIDDSAYGINGRPPCTRDYIEFFDGTDNDADSLHKLCRHENPGPITTTSSQARVVFAGFINRFRPASRVGVRVTYRAIQPEEPEGLCGGRLTEASGSFNSPGWPLRYPQEDFECVWTIELPNTGANIEFTIDDSAYGINGRSPCPTDYIEFFDGTSNSANSLAKLCKFDNPGPITTTTSRARVVFSSSINPHRPNSRVGVKVNYRTV